MFVPAHEDYNNQWLIQCIASEEAWGEIRADLARAALEARLSESAALLDEAKKNTAPRLREMWRELLEKIKEIWRKFSVAVESLVRSDEDWLKKNRDRILDADLDDFEYEIFPYWEAAGLLQRTAVPQFNPRNPEFMEALRSDEAFVAKYFPQIKASPGEGFVEELKQEFRGGESETLKGSAFKHRLPGIIDYCMKYRDIRRLVQRDHDRITQAVQTAMRESISAAARQTQTATTSAEKAQATSGKSEGAGFTLEELYGLALAEDGAKSLEELRQRQKELREKNQKRMQDENNAHKRSIDADATKIDDKDARDVDNSTAEKANENIRRYQRYVRICQQILGAKLSIYEERYRQYMSMLRAIASRKKGEGTSSVRGSLRKIERAKERVADLEKRIEAIDERLKGRPGAEERRSLRQQRDKLERELREARRDAETSERDHEEYYRGG